MIYLIAITFAIFFCVAMHLLIRSFQILQEYDEHIQNLKINTNKHGK